VLGWCSRGSTRCWRDVLEGAPGAGGAGRGAGAAGGRVAGHLTEEGKKMYKKQIFCTLLLAYLCKSWHPAKKTADEDFQNKKKQILDNHLLLFISLKYYFSGQRYLRPPCLWS
jgi:hypothetical protein